MQDSILNLFMLKRLYDQYMQPIAQQHGLRRMELDILLFLANHPNYDTASDIIHRRGLTKSHVSTSIQHLIHNGFLHAQHHENDKKRLHLSLQPSVSSIIKDGRQAQQAFFQLLIKDFQTDEIQMMEALFTKMNANIEDAVSKKEGNYVI